MPKGNPNGQTVDKSYSAGLGVAEAWFAFFRENERAWEEKRYGDVLTDEEIIERVGDMFPTRDSAIMTQPNFWRLRYNRQALTISTRFCRFNGDRLAKATVRGTPIGRWVTIKNPKKKRTVRNGHG